MEIPKFGVLAQHKVGSCFRLRLGNRCSVTDGSEVPSKRMKRNPSHSPFFPICEGALKAFNAVGDIYVSVNARSFIGKRTVIYRKTHGHLSKTASRERVATAVHADSQRDARQTAAVSRCVSELHGKKYRILEIYVFAAWKPVFTCRGGLQGQR